MLSIELAREVLVGLAGVSGLSNAACFRSFIRSIPCWPLSRVKDRNASNRFRDLKTPFIKTLLPRVGELLRMGVSLIDRLTAILMLYDGIHGFEQRLQQGVIRLIGKEKTWRRHRRK